MTRKLEPPVIPARGKNPPYKYDAGTPSPPRKSGVPTKGDLIAKNTPRVTTSRAIRGSKI